MLWNMNYIIQISPYTIVGDEEEVPKGSEKPAMLGVINTSELAGC